VDSAPYPRTNWKYCVTRKMKPKRAKNVTVTAPLAALKRRSRNNVMSSIGLAARRSRMTKATSSPAASAKPPSVGAEDQPCDGASMIVEVSDASIATERDRPGRSSFGTAGSRDSGTQRPAATVVIRASGTSAQKTLPQ
jgi:hypothetical protein